MEPVLGTERAALALLAMRGTTLRLWYYEPPDSATGIAWAEAIKQFKADHPGVNVQFEEKLVSFDHNLAVSKDLRDDRLLSHDTPTPQARRTPPLWTQPRRRPESGPRLSLGRVFSLRELSEGPATVP